MNKTLRKRIFTTALIFLLILLIQGMSIASSKNIVIGTSLMNTWEPFYKDLEEGWKDAAKEFGVELIITSAEGDLAEQISQTETFIAKKVDAIILIPADTVGIIPAVKLANKAGIPVFTADNGSDGGEIVCHIASDNYKMGALIAEYVGERMKGEGKAFMLSAPYITSNYHRCQGFRETLLKKYPGIVVEREICVDFERAKALAATEDILAAFPKSSDEMAIFGLSGGDAGMGAYLGVKAAERDDVFVVTVDAIPECRELIYSGNQILVADAAQFPHVIGYESVKAVVDYLSGKSIPKEIPVLVKSITTQDLVKKGDKILVKGVETD
jgi:ribose transport system substrate-binding protein